MGEGKNTDIVERDDQHSFKDYLIERSRSPADMPDAKGRALMACLNVPQPIQKWMVEAGAAEPLFESIAKTIEAAERNARDVAIQEAADTITRLRSLLPLHEACVEALRRLTEAVGAMRVPQNTAEAAVQIGLTIGPTYENARAALSALDQALGKPE